MAPYKIPNIDGLEDWEIGLLCELRILKQAGVIDHVLDLMASVLEALYGEAERQEAERREKERKRVIRRDSKKYGPLAEGLKGVRGYHSMSPENLRKLINEGTMAGKLLAQSGFKRKEILEAMWQEIAQKARYAGINSCRKYVGSTS